MTAETGGDTPLRPQQASTQRVGINSPHWSVEPYWIGERLLARVSGGRAWLTDASGNAVDDFYRDLAALLPDAVDADEAVLDGVWTVQPFLGPGSAAERWADTVADAAPDPEVARPDPADLETRRAFVVVDVVELDGTFLGDVPYQERRRLLTGLVTESDRLRVTPAVRTPLGSWFHAWRENGFDRGVAKHINSRYQPGLTTTDWIVITIEPERAVGVQRLFWKDRKKKDITD